MWMVVRGLLVRRIAQPPRKAKSKSGFGVASHVQRTGGI